MTSTRFIQGGVLAIFVTSFFAPPGFAETIKLDDGTSCTVIENTGSSDTGTSTSVTAGGGSVSSSTTINGKTTTMQSGSGSSSSSSAASAGATGSEAFSTASITRPDGTVVTRRSDGTCEITKPQK